MELYIWLLGIFSIVCGATNGFAGFWGAEDSPKENADRLSFFIAAVGIGILAINAI